MFWKALFSNIAMLLSASIQSWLLELSKRLTYIAPEYMLENMLILESVFAQLKNNKAFSTITDMRNNFVSKVKKEGQENAYIYTL